MINHINLLNANGQVYCCLRNRVVRFDEVQQNKFCSGCKMYNGDAGGNGVECLWDDIREKDSTFMIVVDPLMEWMSNQVKPVRTQGMEWSASHYYNGGKQAVV